MSTSGCAAGDEPLAEPATTTQLAVVTSNAPLRTSGGLVAVTLFERTGGSGPDAYAFSASGAELTTRRGDPLGPGNADFTTPAGEAYDVYYSNADGSFNVDGGFLTVDAVYTGTDPTNGGLNLAEVQLSFSDGTTQLAGGIASFFGAGGNSVLSRVTSAVDGNFATHTSMGNTSGISQRLRVTLSFHAPVALAQTPSLSSITVFERTGGTSPTPFTFAASSAALTTRRGDPLSGGNSDFSTTAGEAYDVYYSNADGSVNANGAFLTVEALYTGTAVNGGGLNLAEVQLNFSNGTTRFARGVSSFLGLGGNGHLDRVPSAVDGTLATHTSMGNTSGQSGRLRLTVGF